MLACLPKPFRIAVIAAGTVLTSALCQGQAAKAATGSFFTGHYRNLFREPGIAQAEIDRRVSQSVVLIDPAMMTKSHLQTIPASAHSRWLFKRPNRRSTLSLRSVVSSR